MPLYNLLQFNLLKLFCYFCREDDYPLIKKIFPKAQFIVIPGAGHWVHSERPSEFLEALCNFL